MIDITPLDHELNQLIVMDKLKKKINALNIHWDKLQGYKWDESRGYIVNESIDMILIKRKLEKAKQLVLKYLNILKQDTQFNISMMGNICYIMNYERNYVHARKTGSIAIEGVLNE